MSKVTCPECGAVYERREHKVTFRDKDSQSCGCGYELESWNGSRIPSYELITRGRETKTGG